MIAVGGKSSDTDASRGSVRNWGALLTIPVTVTLLVLFDVARLPPDGLHDPVGRTVGAFFVGASCVYAGLLGPLLYAIGVLTLESLPCSRGTRIAGHWIVAAALGLGCFELLSLATSPLRATIVVAVMVTFFGGQSWLGTIAGRDRRLLRLGLMTSSVGAFAAAQILIDRMVNSSLSLRFVLLWSAFAALFCSVLHAYLLLESKSGRGRGARIVVFATLAAPALLGVIWRGSADVRPHVLLHMAVGQTKVIVDPYTTDRERGRGEVVEDDPHGHKRFIDSCGLPRLPADFDLSRYNVLFITAETTRYRDTSLAETERGTTPNLSSLLDAGAYWCPRAYSPSSGTLQSMASVMAMKVPSLAPLETWHRSWNGKLLPSAKTAAEVFLEEGYETFWVGHNQNGCFDTTILGLDQGFETRSLVDSPGRSLTTGVDQEVTQRTMKLLSEFAESKSRFFGWVFFVSPHWKYSAYDGEEASTSAHERYLQEIRHMDEQLGTLLSHLREVSLIRDTVLVFLADHGEEFGEHGGERHWSTVYSELVHVPLVVRIPGVRGHSFAGPTSTLYVLPWLLAQGTEGMRREARARFETELGPMLKETDGAVVVELIGHDIMCTSLVYPRFKLNYDLVAGLPELYDAIEDPFERTNLLAAQPELWKAFAHRWDGYLKVRAARGAYETRPRCAGSD